ncbi:MAG: DUF4333 domain-containing protein [Schumannella sp.]|nr:DUF4333 domain-containing protein [Microbacteriaceae bacterium]
MRTRKLSLVLTGAAAGLLLSGCTFSLTPQILEVPGSDVATVVEDKLEEQVGARPDVDCGDDSVQLEVGNTLNCVLTDPDTGLEYNVIVTFTSVKGTDYTFDFSVADSPNNPPQPTVDPQAPTVPGSDIAALVVTALTPQLEAPPQVNCPEPEVEISVGNITYCTYTDAEGTHDVQVTITQYDPAQGTYTINASVMAG